MSPRRLQQLPYARSSLKSRARSIFLASVSVHSRVSRWILADGSRVPRSYICYSLIKGNLGTGRCMSTPPEKSPRISVTVSNEMQKKLNEIADRKGLSVSSLVRTKLLEWLRECQDGCQGT